MRRERGDATYPGLLWISLLILVSRRIFVVLVDNQNDKFSVAVSFFLSSRRRHTRCGRDWRSDVCSSDLRSIPAALSACDSGTRYTNRDMYASAEECQRDWGRPEYCEPGYRSGPGGSSRVWYGPGYRSEERRVGKDGRSRWWPYH